MVFAAGLGTRMLPLSRNCPKPLIKVAGKALIDHVLDPLAKIGVPQAIVNIHYLADQIEAHVKNRSAPEIIISDERKLLLDQGGGIRKVLPLIGSDPFLICNTDAFWIEGASSNLNNLIKAWEPDAMDILLLVAPAATSIGVDSAGDFFMDAEGRLHRRQENGVAPFVYTGVGIMKPELIEAQKKDVFKLAPIFFEAALQNRLFGLRLDGLWLHVGTPEAVHEAELAIQRSKL
jgi:MurNAc alpha-1-phosphate uridylyltransferase